MNQTDKANIEPKENLYFPINHYQSDTIAWFLLLFFINFISIFLFVYKIDDFSNYLISLAIGIITLQRLVIITFLESYVKELIIKFEDKTFEIEYFSAFTFFKIQKLLIPFGDYLYFERIKNTGRYTSSKVMILKYLGKRIEIDDRDLSRDNWDLVMKHLTPEEKDALFEQVREIFRKYAKNREYVDNKFERKW